MNMVSPAWTLSASSASWAAMPGQPDHRRLVDLDIVRDAAHCGGGQGDVVGEATGARTEVDAGDDAGDPVADPDLLDVGAECAHGADEVAAEHDRELVRQ